MNPIVILAEKCQAEYRANITTKVVNKVGEDHRPTITVEIELPNGNVYRASGANQKIAKQKAAEIALEIEF